jgi:hypothetical protein
MTNQHPITPPEELLERWYRTGRSGNWQNALTLAYRAGANQQLEATDTWIRTNLKGRLRPANRIADDHRADMRPDPPSQAEQALDALKDLDQRYPSSHQAITIRAALERLRALEQLPDAL